MEFCLSSLPCHFTLTLCCFCCFWNSFLFRSALRYRKVSLSPLPAGNETWEYAQGENKLISGLWSLDCFCNEFVILLFLCPLLLWVSLLCVFQSCSELRSGWTSTSRMQMGEGPSSLFHIASIFFPYIFCFSPCQSFPPLLPSFSRLDMNTTDCSYRVKSPSRVPVQIFFC